VAKWLECVTAVREDPNSNDTAGGCLSQELQQYAAFGTGCTGRYCSAQVNSALHSSGVAKSSTSFGWSKGGKVKSAGWQVTLCDPIWHVSSRSYIPYIYRLCSVQSTATFRQAELLQFVGQRVGVDSELGGIAEYE